jgi:hypothetical protein
VAACLQRVEGGAKALATITFLVVKAAFPRGKPAGIVYPAGAKKGCVWSTPSSRTAIFIPSPVEARLEVHSAGAPISRGELSRAKPYPTVGATEATPGSEASRGS